MGKLTQKLSIYLDQNFISEIAKVKINPNVHEDYKTIFDLIHEGFLEEKIIVPKSFFHKVETHMARELSKRIRNYQSYMGQISLHHYDTIETFQLVRAGKNFLGEEQKNEDWSSAYHEDPDTKLRQFDITVDGGNWLELFTQNNTKIVQDLGDIQKKIADKNIKYDVQYQLEMESARKNFLQYNIGKVAWLFKDDIEKIKKFVASKYFEIPKYKIYSQMWAYLLIKYNKRKIKESDLMDIDIISTYLPYVDVLATDTFMGLAIRELKLDEEYSTKIFLAKEDERGKFIDYLKNYLENSLPVNIPDASIFVISDDTIKHDCLDFFNKLGLLTMNDHGGWVELYAFDDGKMPKYYNKKIKSSWPFYGLHNVKVIKFTKKMNVLEECKKRCRSKRFVLIDHYRNIPDNFKDTLIDYCNSGKNKILGYNIYNYNLIY